MCLHWTKPRAWDPLHDQFGLLHWERYIPGVGVLLEGEVQIHKPKDEFCYKKGKNFWKGHSNPWPLHLGSIVGPSKQTQLSDFYGGQGTSSHPLAEVAPLPLNKSIIKHTSLIPVPIHVASSTPNFKSYLGALVFVISLISFKKALN